MRTIEYDGIWQKSYTKKKENQKETERDGIHQNNRTGHQSNKCRCEVHMAASATQ
jgi:hypothetical protein